MNINIAYINLDIDKLSINIYKKDNVKINNKKHNFVNINNENVAIGYNEETMYSSSNGTFSRFVISISSKNKSSNELEDMLKEKIDDILSQCLKIYSDSIFNRMKNNYNYGSYCY